MKNKRQISHSSLLRLSAVASLSLLACSSWAQDNATLTPVVVTANPLGTSELIAPVDQLNNYELLQRGQSTLGETLNGLPGVSSSYFGPNASRPVIRGLDSDRITILTPSSTTVAPTWTSRP
jgi:iron complex outermembrane recepter protein